MKVINGITRLTETEYKTLQELYNNFTDAFHALPFGYKNAFWIALYQPQLRLKD